MSELTFTEKLANRMEMLGFKVWLVHQLRGKPKFNATPGHADITAFGHGVTLFVETKVDRGTQSPAQKEFETWATKNGALYWVVRSIDEFMVCGQAKGWWR